MALHVDFGVVRVADGGEVVRSTLAIEHFPSGAAIKGQIANGPQDMYWPNAGHLFCTDREKCVMPGYLTYNLAQGKHTALDNHDAAVLPVQTVIGQILETQEQPDVVCLQETWGYQDDIAAAAEPYGYAVHRSSDSTHLYEGPEPACSQSRAEKAVACIDNCKATPEDAGCTFACTQDDKDAKCSACLGAILTGDKNVRGGNKLRKCSTTTNTPAKAYRGNAGLMLLVRRGMAEDAAVVEHPLPSAESFQRAILTAQSQEQPNQLVACAHLGTKEEERARHLDALFALQPTVVLGTLNAPAEEFEATTYQHVQGNGARDHVLTAQTGYSRIELDIEEVGERPPLFVAPKMSS